MVKPHAKLTYAVCLPCQMPVGLFVFSSCWSWATVQKQSSHVTWAPGVLPKHPGRYAQRQFSCQQWPWWYCWWLHEIRGDHQLIYGKCPIIFLKVLAPSLVVVWDFWTINRSLTPCTKKNSPLSCCQNLCDRKILCIIIHRNAGREHQQT